jgi:hypothetical protein
MKIGRLPLHDDKLSVLELTTYISPTVLHTRRHFYWFVGSLRKIGFKGDIVLAVNQNIPKPLEDFLKENRVIAYPL